jgi:hypothetical protein
MPFLKVWYPRAGRFATRSSLGFPGAGRFATRLSLCTVGLEGSSAFALARVRGAMLVVVRG